MCVCVFFFVVGGRGGGGGGVVVHLFCESSMYHGIDMGRFKGSGLSWAPQTEAVSCISRGLGFRTRPIQAC